MTANDSKSTPKKAEDAATPQPRRPLELLAREWEHAANFEAINIEEVCAFRRCARELRDLMTQMESQEAALRAQAEAEAGQVQIDLQEHFSVIRGTLSGYIYVPQHLRALLDSPYNAQRERDTADGLAAALAQAGGEG